MFLSVIKCYSKQQIKWCINNKSIRCKSKRLYYAQYLDGLKKYIYKITYICTHIDNSYRGWRQMGMRCRVKEYFHVVGAKYLLNQKEQMKDVFISEILKYKFQINLLPDRVNGISVNSDIVVTRSVILFWHPILFCHYPRMWEIKFLLSTLSQVTVVTSQWLHGRKPFQGILLVYIPLPAPNTHTHTHTHTDWETGWNNR